MSTDLFPQYTETKNEKKNRKDALENEKKNEDRCGSDDSCKKRCP